MTKTGEQGVFAITCKKGLFILKLKYGLQRLIKQLGTDRNSLIPISSHLMDK